MVWDKLVSDADVLLRQHSSASDTDDPWASKDATIQEISSSTALEHFRNVVETTKFHLKRDDGTEKTPLEYWASWNQKSPMVNRLLPLIRMYVGAPCSSSASESVWSYAKRVKGHHRSRLSPTRFNSEVLISSNREFFNNPEQTIESILELYHSSASK
mmetsp:Transcript_14732/g.21996  ORF Transcript_14732/g.21996 Transcript_14732/m.21996 type:complete len:158 (+) Transcript_14732:376-849(+)